MERNKGSEINPHSYRDPAFDKCVKIYTEGKKNQTAYSIKDAERTGYPPTEQ